MVRRVVALVAGILFIVLLVFLVRGCINAQEERAYEDYVQEVSSLLAESDQQSDGLFELLQGSGQQSQVDVQNNVNGFRVESEQLVERARAADHPDALEEAQDQLVQTLQFRSEGITGIASRLPSALGDEGRGDAVSQIAAQMQNFLTSDVIYSQRVIPNLEGALRTQGLQGEVGDVPQSQFLPDIDWLQPDIVAATIAGLRGDAADDASAAPGLHGTGLGEVTVQPSGDVLVEGTTTQVALGDEAAFEVEVSNQGENDESDVPVTITIEGGDQPIELEGEVETIAQGDTATATIPLTEQPPTDQELDLTVAIEPVPGEEMADNNEGTFPVTFTP